MKLSPAPSLAGEASEVEMKTPTVLIYGVGDVAPMTYAPMWESRVREIRGSGSIFQEVTSFLRQADIVFCQLEIPLSNRAEFSLPQARRADFARPETAELLQEAGFKVVSFASNHCWDWGPGVLLDTIEALKNSGMAVVGVGESIRQARRPALLTVKGLRVAFLAYNSILPLGYWAEEDRPGCAPLRAWTFYEQIEHDQPGTPCRVRTFPHWHDLEAALEDVREAKKVAQLVIVSLHWGIHFVPGVLADYQRVVAHQLMDAGADLILGHHPHILKPIEVYRGKVIFYSLGNFATDLPFTPELAQQPSFREIQQLNPEWVPDPDVLYNCPPESMRTMVAKCLASPRGIEKVSFLPAYIDRQTARPRILPASEDRFWDVLEYVQRITSSQHLSTSYRVEGDEVVIEEGAWVSPG